MFIHPRAHKHWAQNTVLLAYIKKKKRKKKGTCYLLEIYKKKDLIFLQGPNSGVTNNVLLGACIVGWTTVRGFMGWDSLGGISLCGRMIGLVTGHLLVHLL